MGQFAWSAEPNAILKLAPQKRQALWKKLEIEPNGIDSAVVEIMHRTHMGVDHDYKHLIMGGLKCSLADGWVGSMVATTVFRHPLRNPNADPQPREPGRDFRH